MAHRILMLVGRPAAADESTLMDVRDVYDLPTIDLSAYAGIVVSGGCDQRFLALHGAAVADWVRAGGRLLVNGHPVLRWLEGLPAHRKMEFHNTDDLWLSAVEEHPIWAGVDRRDLLFNTGIPGEHSFEEMQEIGVAGFYAHAYLVSLPAGCRVITGIGQGRLPVDVAYPLGDGEVVLHIGNDLFGAGGMRGPSGSIKDQALTFLEEAR